MLSIQGRHLHSPISEAEIHRIAEVLADPPALSDADRKRMWDALCAARFNRMVHVSEALQPAFAFIAGAKPNG